MIDTIGFKVMVNEQVTQQMKKSVFQRLRRETFNLGESEVIFDFFTTEFSPSWDRSIKLKIDDINNLLDFSGGFSLPKFVYGHNCYMLYDFRAALNLFKDKFENHFEVVLPEIDTWPINRVDVCYNFKLKDNQEVIKTIDYFKSFEYPRKKPHIYKTSLYYATRAYTFKLYEKQAEYLVHDYKHFRKIGKMTEAEEFLRLADSLLRLEVEMRTPALKYHFKKDKIFVSDLSLDFVTERLKFYLSKFLSLGGTHSNRSQVYYALSETFGSERAAKLYMFWSALSQDKERVRNALPKSTYYDNLRKLRKAGISIYSVQTENPVNLIIPTANCSNVGDLWKVKV